MGGEVRNANNRAGQRRPRTSRRAQTPQQRGAATRRRNRVNRQLRVPASLGL